MTGAHIEGGRSFFRVLPVFTESISRLAAGAGHNRLLWRLRRATVLYYVYDHKSVTPVSGGPRSSPQSSDSDCEGPIFASADARNAASVDASRSTKRSLNGWVHE